MNVMRPGYPIETIMERRAERLSMAWIADYGS
jgi:hypothetical protein